ncbi:lea domain-containing protein [Moniliophthora roreri]|uniref:DUF6987 domain-containing protein n=1 Tax=Moniliophthora roreri TaxID=221103 RepID=A0A0W0GCK3_MONRR|nr:lea domain-containing protein [Moniliophthora roreri]
MSQGDIADIQLPTHADNRSEAGFTDSTDQRTPEQQKADKELAERLAILIEDANSRVVPLTRMIRKHIENMDSKKEEDRDENELVKQVKPLLEQAEKILNETQGAIKGADPDKRLSNKATRHYQDHRATPEEQRLAEALKVLLEEVGGTIEWAKNKLESFPKAKRDLGPLLDALGQPLTQIVGGVGLLLAGVLNLVGNLLSGLGLDSLLKGIISATGLDKIYKGLGLDKWLNTKK